MNIKRAGKNIVVETKKPMTYRIGFNDGDETELNVSNMSELEELWLSLCPEFGCAPDSVDYVHKVGYEEAE